MFTYEDLLKEKEEMIIRAIMNEKYHDRVPTVKVKTAVLNSPKNISKLVKLLGDLMPVPKLQHLKRVKRRDKRFYVVIDFLDEEEEEQQKFTPKRPKLDEKECLTALKSKGIDCEELGIVSVEIAEVPEFGPKTRAQYQKAMEYWPVNFHPEKKIETMMSEKVFDDWEYEYHVDNMKRVLKVAEQRRANAAMIFDFEEKRLVAMGFDRVHEHPLQHAIMVAVDAVASTQSGGAWNLPFQDLTPEERNGETKGSIADESRMGAEGKEAGKDSAPYLCTKYDAYVVREPCVMCAMSLVHSRIKRVFFNVRNPEKGGLVSRCQVHTIRDLNHHYEVFEVTKLEKVKENENELKRQ